MSKWSIPISLFFASVATVLLCPYGLAESQPRFSVIHFDGVTEYPRGSQFSVGGNTNLILPPESAIRPVRLLLVADALKNEVWLHAMMSPWRLDLGVMDSEREFLWHQTNEGTMLFFERALSQSKSSMWSVGLRSVLADGFAIPISADASSVVESIKNACLAKVPSTPSDNFVIGDSLESRISSTDGTSLIVNHFRAGEVESAVRMQHQHDQFGSFEVVSTCFGKGRPVEIRRGTLHAKQSDSMPEEIEESLRHVSREKSVPIVPIASSKRLKQSELRNIALGVFWFGSVAFLMATLVFPFLMGEKKNVVST